MSQRKHMLAPPTPCDREELANGWELAKFSVWGGKTEYESIAEAKVVKQRAKKQLTKVESYKHTHTYMHDHE